MKDRLFIFVSAVLIVLFAAVLLENANLFFHSSGRDNIEQPSQLQTETDKRTDKILSRLEEAGLKPQEARYYKVIDE